MEDKLNTFYTNLKEVDSLISSIIASSKKDINNISKVDMINTLKKLKEKIDRNLELSENLSSEYKKNC